MKHFVNILFLFAGIHCFGQYIPASLDAHLSQFLSELESEHYIKNYNTSAFNYSEKEVYALLQEAELNSSGQNERQKRELGFYLRQFRTSNEPNLWQEHDIDLARSGDLFSLSLNPPGLFIRGENAGVSITPLAGALFTLSAINTSLKKHWGAQISGNANAFGYYFSFRNNLPSPFTYESYVENNLPTSGFNYHTQHEINGGISFSTNMLTAAISFDNQALFPYTEKLTLFRTETPSYPSLMVSFTPVDFVTYQFRTGFINADENNLSISSYFEGTRLKTSFALNQFILNPFHQIELTIGQAAFMKHDRYHANYLIPVNLYLTKNENENSFFFFRINVAAIKHVQISFSETVDDFKWARTRSDYDKNVHAYAFDIELTDWPLRNTALRFNHTLQTPLFMDHTYSPIYNLWPATNSEKRDNQSRTGIQLSLNPIHNLMVYAKFQRENVGDSFTYEKELPYDFSTLETIRRHTDILSFEFIVKPAYNTSLLAGLHFVNHKGQDPAFRLAEYNQKVDFFFRMGLIIGL